MDSRFNRERIRFHTKKKNTLVIQGWFENDSGGAEQFEARMGGERLPLEIRVQRGVEVTKKYLRYRTNVMAEYFLMVTLPREERAWKELRVYHVTGAQAGAAASKEDPGREKSGEAANTAVSERTCVCRLSSRALMGISRRLESWMESLRELPDGRYQLRGWYMGCAKAELALLSGNGTPLKTECTLGVRSDILGEFPEAELPETRGFELVFEKPEENLLRLAMKGGGKKALYIVNCRKLLSGREGIANVCRKSWRYLKRKGFRQFTKRVSDVVLGIDSISYERWRKKCGTTRQELEAQKRERFSYEPKISILVPLYRTQEKFLRSLIKSVEEQTYRNWELVLSDGSGPDSPLEGLLAEYEKKDSRIRVIRNDRQLRIAENTNEAMWEATGEYLIFGDHDDLFAPDALYECVRVLNEKPQTELIYSDEDKTDAGGRRYFEPHFKPDYSPDLLCSMNYFCHLVLVKRSLQSRVGVLDAAYEGAQDYDYVLRCTEHTTPGQIVHIPKILYHWRSHGESTAENPESKRYAFEAGKRAVQAHYDRLGIPAKAENGEYAGIYHSRYEIQGEPLVSILIPNKDHIEDLRKCLRSILEKSDYSNYEIIIIENNSTQPETFEEYKRLEQEDDRVRVVYYDTDSSGKAGFNFSAINNFGAACARGDYYLLLNNDTEMIDSGCLRELLGVCQRPEVGIVGALLFYEDDTIQHAGVVLGFGGIAGHAFIGSRRGDNGYFSRIICAQNYSAVTAACMMVKASVFHEVGGLSEELAVAFNDIDFCMKVRRAGSLIVYNPHACLYHYESKSRGLENTQEKIERFNREMAWFLDRWGDEVKSGDPYYNPNLTLDKADFSLRF